MNWGFFSYTLDDLFINYFSESQSGTFIIAGLFLKLDVITPPIIRGRVLLVD